MNPSRVFLTPALCFRGSKAAAPLKAGEFVRLWNAGGFVRQYTIWKDGRSISFVLTGPTWPERLEKYGAIEGGGVVILGNLCRRRDGTNVCGLIAGQVMVEAAERDREDLCVYRKEIMFRAESQCYRHLLRFPPAGSWMESLMTMGVRSGPVTGIPSGPGDDPLESRYLMYAPDPNRLPGVLSVSRRRALMEASNFVVRVPEGESDWEDWKDISESVGLGPWRVYTKLLWPERIVPLLGFRLALVSASFCNIYRTLIRVRDSAAGSVRGGPYGG